MIKVRLDFFVETNKLLPPCQFGFRKGRSTAESLITFLNDMKSCQLSKSTAVCVFLDVQGAYDNVDLIQLIKILHDLGLPGKLLKWIFNFSSDRTLYVKYNNQLHGPKKTWKGLMQGACMSPLLFNLYTSQIINFIPHNTSILQFADDVLIYTINRNIKSAETNINLALQQLNLFYSLNLKLKINSEKSSVMVLGNDITSVKVLYNNKQIPLVNEKKFLGVIFDNKLTFKSHIDYICHNAMKGINIMRSLAGTFWGSDPNILSTIYKSLIRSHFDYSGIVYMNARPTFLKKIDVIQNMALRIISGAMRTTPIISMEVETCIEPLPIRRILFAEKFSTKLLACNSPIILNKLPDTLSISQQSNVLITVNNVVTGQFPELLGVFNLVFKKTKNIYKNDLWPLYVVSYDSLFAKMEIDVSHVGSKFEFYEFLSKKDDFYVLYTDGSKSGNNTKSAYYDPQKKLTKCFKLDNHCTIFTAETYAIYQCLLYVCDMEKEKKNVLIISDSMSVLLSLDNYKLSYKLNYLIYLIRKIIFDSGKTVTFKWVPSHSGICGNETVDRAANAEHDEDHSQVLKVPFTDYVTLLKVEKRQLWESYWQLCSENKGIWYKEIQKKIPCKPWYCNIKLFKERKFITIINRMRFGHCLTPAHLHRMKITNSSHCQFCNDENADLTHIILKCSNFSTQRLTLVTEITEKLEEHFEITKTRTALEDDDLRMSFSVSDTYVSVSEDLTRRVQELLSNERLFPSLYKFITATVEKI